MYNSEITFLEFKECLLVFFLKREFDSKKGKKGDKLKSFFKKCLTKFLEGNIFIAPKPKLKDMRKFGKYEKDDLKTRLKERLEEERKRREAAKIKAAERAREENEIK